jgi:transcriptional regulator with GAF, ATPase, and Fis domain
VSTLTEVTDLLVDDNDIIDFLQVVARRCHEVLAVDAVAVLVIDRSGRLVLVATSTSNSATLAACRALHLDGPAISSMRSRRAILCADLGTQSATWPSFTTFARLAGFAAAHTLPVRLGNQALGALTLFSATPGRPDNDELSVARVFANIAAVGIVYEHGTWRDGIAAEKLQNALDDRVRIEQARGIIAGRVGCTVDEADQMLRAFARTNHRTVADAGRAVVAGDTSVTAIIAAAGA